MVGLKDMARSDAERAPPTWLRKLLETRFFEDCTEHPAGEGHANRRTTGCNFFCTQCPPGHALCSDCLSTHEGHKLIQIRRLSGHDVVKVDDIKLLLSVSLVQTYVYNEGRVVYLNRRPMLGHGRHATSHCDECNRGLLDEAYHFCSLGCKADGIEDRLDFSVSFAIDANNDNPRDEPEADNNEDEDKDEDEDEDSPYDAEDEDSSSPSDFEN